MENNKNNKAIYKESFMASFPVAVGHFSVAMGFGLIAKNMSVTFGDTSLMSILVYAGASQLMALDLLNLGVSYAGIILATFLLNLRNMMMSASLSIDFEDIPKKYLPLIGFGITDVTFSVISFNKEKISLPFVGIIVLVGYGAWIAGTIVGFGVGQVLPASFQSSLSIGLYAMFAALLFPNIKRSNKALMVALMASAIYIGLHYFNIFALGWDIIIAIIMASVIGGIVFE